MNENIGYINPSVLSKGQLNQMMEEFKDTKGMIVDLRYYPSGFIAYTLAGYLVPKATSFAKFSYANPAIPREYVFANSSRQY